MNRYSIIIPIFNCENYIGRCLDSIINQTYKNIEIIIVNDGSYDSSLNICEKYWSIDNRIVLLDITNSGVSSARNIGLSVATGDYALFVDGDDYFISNNCIKTLDNLLGKTSCDLLIAEIFPVRLNSHKLESSLFTTKELFKYLLKNKSLIERVNSVCAKVYLLEKIKTYNIRFNSSISIGEDLLFNLNYLKFTDSVYWSHLYVYYYNTSNVDSMTKKLFDDKFEQLSIVNHEFDKFLDEYEDVKLHEINKYLRSKKRLFLLI